MKQENYKVTFTNNRSFTVKAKNHNEAIVLVNAKLVDEGMIAMVMHTAVKDVTKI